MKGSATTMAATLRVELVRLLELVSPLDLASTYRILKDLTTAEDLQIARVISDLLLSGELEMESRVPRSSHERGPVVAILRLPTWLVRSPRAAIGADVAYQGPGCCET